MKKSFLISLVLLFIFHQNSKAQFLMDMIDTTKDIGRGMLSMYKNFDHIRISGYLQPQFQLAQSKGAPSYIGGDFAPNSDNRFMIRRGRIRFDYARFSEEDLPSLQFAFQFDGTERGVFIRDFWGRYFENKFNLFSLTTGMFTRPFGYELNLSSSYRESPERGRMSQILMKNERDLGAMITFSPQKSGHPLRYLQIDAGLFNGQGLTATTDFDSHKDFISRISLKPYPLSKRLSVSAGLSYLNGGLIQNNKYIYRIQQGKFIVDSTVSNIHAIAPRKYYGADLQLKLKTLAGITELRAEYWQGQQTATASSSETPSSLLNEPYYIRNFDGAFFYLLHQLKSKKDQFGIKLDWYDPNTKVKSTQIGAPSANLEEGDIKFTTVGLGYIHYFNENLKFVLWYDIVKNETTLLPGYTSDLKDNILTCRMQFKF